MMRLIGTPRSRAISCKASASRSNIARIGRPESGSRAARSRSVSLRSMMMVAISAIACSVRKIASTRTWIENRATAPASPGPNNWSEKIDRSGRTKPKIENAPITQITARSAGLREAECHRFCAISAISRLELTFCAMRSASSSPAAAQAHSNTEVNTTLAA